MSEWFNAGQLDILYRIIPNALGEGAVNRIVDGQLSLEEIDRICAMINNEFVWEANDYGKELEKILDIVNRPRLHR